MNTHIINIFSLLSTPRLILFNVTKNIWNSLRIKYKNLGVNYFYNTPWNIYPCIAYILLLKYIIKLEHKMISNYSIQLVNCSLSFLVEWKINTPKGVVFRRSEMAGICCFEFLSIMKRGIKSYISNFL